ncbi:hypothetical protein GGE45_002710 [Rhizobium aethiopicum]|uniref:hypothetical protein n=1 Tax=Rhizobium aethiopicum TaxID=1138170 RepID=UPI00161023EA|nr:hypothetical protein [Rhizobium aethiopicum]MBB4580380.1 hypothetical protein [Rhizobium aethiopicum]
MLGKPKTTPSAKVRSLADADPTYAAAKELVARLKASAAKIDAEESELLTRLASRPATTEKTGRVAALLGDAAPDDDEAPDGLRARLKAIAVERVDLRAAIDIAQQRLTQARFGASRVIVAEVASTYSERVQSLAKALIVAHAAHNELLHLINDLNVEDIAWAGVLEPMQASNIFGHDGGRLATWLRSAAAAGFIKASDIPTELRA